MTWYVVDGLDGSGKSTAAACLVSGLEERGRSVLLIEHPSADTFFGRISGKLLLKTGKPAVLLASVFYFLDVLCSIRRMRRTACDDVVFVRYLLEVAYFPKGLHGICYRVASGVLPEPDLGILVDVPPEEAMRRISERGDDLEVFENIPHLSRTRDNMLELAVGWTVVDNSGDERRLRESLSAILDASQSERP